MTVLHCPCCGRSLTFRPDGANVERAICADCNVDIVHIETDDQTGEFSLTVAPCGSGDEPDGDEDEEALLDVSYQCPGCGHEWVEQWASACDSTCPSCGYRDISPVSYAPAHHRCAGCDTVWPTAELKPVRDLAERAGPDDLPSGECPECHALCYPIGDDDLEEDEEDEAGPA